jgi:hypothetical protein
VAAWDALQAEHEARRQAFDLPRLEHEERVASECYRASWKALAATPAATVAGAMLKARIAVECHDGPEGFPRWVEAADTTDKALSLSAVLDLARLSGEA